MVLAFYKSGGGDLGGAARRLVKLSVMAGALALLAACSNAPGEPWYREAARGVRPWAELGPGASPDTAGMGVIEATQTTIEALRERPRTVGLKTGFTF